MCVRACMRACACVRARARVGVRVTIYARIPSCTQQAITDSQAVYQLFIVSLRLMPLYSSKIESVLRITCSFCHLDHDHYPAVGSCGRKSHLVRTQSLNVLPFKPGVGQYIAIHATLTARDLFFTYTYPSGLFTCIFSKTSPIFFLCWLWLTPVSV